MAGVMRGYFADLRARVLSSFDRYAAQTAGNLAGMSRRKAQEVLSRDAFSKINPDKKKEAETVSELIRPKMEEALGDGAESTIQATGSSGLFLPADPEVVGWLGERLDMFSREVAGTTFREIGQILRAGFAEGQPLPLIADTLRVKFASWDRYRAPLIARTEAMSALNKGSILGARASGATALLRKVWLTAADEHVRLSHEQAGVAYAKGVPLKELFRVGNDAMDAPGCGKDPSENINCRCTVGYIRSRSGARKPGVAPTPPPPVPPPPVVPLPVKPAPSKPAPPKPAPPKPAAPAPEPPKAEVPEWAKDKTPVSKHMPIGPGLPKDLKAAYTEAAKLIDSVHDDGPLQDVILKKSIAPTSTTNGYFQRGGTMVTYGPQGLEAVPMAPEISVNIARKQEGWIKTIIHEIGHWLDHSGLVGIGPKGKAPRPRSLKQAMASEIEENILNKDGLLSQWWDAVTNSDTYKELKSLRGRAGEVITVEREGQVFSYKITNKHTNYLLQHTELMARSYSQYIGVKTKDPGVLGAMAKIREHGVYGKATQWEAADFEPIVKAFDDLFRGLGWLKE